MLLLLLLLPTELELCMNAFLFILRNGVIMLTLMMTLLHASQHDNDNDDNDNNYSNSNYNDYAEVDEHNIVIISSLLLYSCLSLFFFLLFCNVSYIFSVLPGVYVLKCSLFCNRCCCCYIFNPSTMISQSVKYMTVLSMLRLSVPLFTSWLSVFLSVSLLENHHDCCKTKQKNWQRQIIA